MSPTHTPTTTAKSRRTLGAALGLALVVAAAPFLNSASAAQPAGDATASGETTAVTGANATAKDSAIWVHPTDPTKSLILGANDTRLEVYDLAGDVTAQAGVPSRAPATRPTVWSPVSTSARRSPSAARSPVTWPPSSARASSGST